MPTYRVMGIMEDGQPHCFVPSLSEQDALDWCDRHEDDYPETSLFVERVPTLTELLCNSYSDY